MPASESARIDIGPEFVAGVLADELEWGPIPLVAGQRLIRRVRRQRRGDVGTVDAQHDDAVVDGIGHRTDLRHLDAGERDARHLAGRDIGAAVGKGGSHPVEGGPRSVGVRRTQQDLAERPLLPDPPQGERHLTVEQREQVPVDVDPKADGRDQPQLVQRVDCRCECALAEARLETREALRDAEEHHLRSCRARDPLGQRRDPGAEREGVARPLAGDVGIETGREPSRCTPSAAAVIASAAAW